MNIENEYRRENVYTLTCTIDKEKAQSIIDLLRKIEDDCSRLRCEILNVIFVETKE